MPITYEELAKTLRQTNPQRYNEDTWSSEALVRRFINKEPELKEYVSDWEALYQPTAEMRGGDLQFAAYQLREQFSGIPEWFIGSIAAITGDKHLGAWSEEMREESAQWTENYLAENPEIAGYLKWIEEEPITAENWWHSEILQRSLAQAAPSMSTMIATDVLLMPITGGVPALINKARTGQKFLKGFRDASRLKGTELARRVGVTGSMGVYEAAGEYSEAMSYLVDEKGMDPLQAQQIAAASAATVGTINGIIEYMPYGMFKNQLFNSEAKKVGQTRLIRRITDSFLSDSKIARGVANISDGAVKQALAEGGQEWTQHMVQTLSQFAYKNGYGDTEETAFEEFIKQATSPQAIASAHAGGTMGLLMGGFTGGVSGLTARQKRALDREDMFTEDEITYEGERPPIMEDEDITVEAKLAGVKEDLTKSQFIMRSFTGQNIGKMTAENISKMEKVEEELGDITTQDPIVKENWKQAIETIIQEDPESLQDLPDRDKALRSIEVEFGSEFRSEVEQVWEAPEIVEQVAPKEPEVREEIKAPEDIEAPRPPEAGEIKTIDVGEAPVETPEILYKRMDDWLTKEQQAKEGKKFSDEEQLAELKEYGDIVDELTEGNNLSALSDWISAKFDAFNARMKEKYGRRNNEDWTSEEVAEFEALRAINKRSEYFTGVAVAKLKQKAPAEGFELITDLSAEDIQNRIPLDKGDKDLLNTIIDDAIKEHGNDKFKIRMTIRGYKNLDEALGQQDFNMIDRLVDYKTGAAKVGDPIIEEDIKEAPAKVSTKPINVYHGTSKDRKPLVEEETIQLVPEKTLVINTDQAELIKKLQDEKVPGSEVFTINEEMKIDQGFRATDRFLSNYYKDQYEFIQYNNQNLPQKGPEYHRLGDNKFFTTKTEMAELYARQISRKDIAIEEAPVEKKITKLADIPHIGKEIKDGKIKDKDQIDTFNYKQKVQSLWGIFTRIAREPADNNEIRNKDIARFNEAKDLEKNLKERGIEFDKKLPESLNIGKDSFYQYYNLHSTKGKTKEAKLAREWVNFFDGNVTGFEGEKAPSILDWPKIQPAKQEAPAEDVKSGDIVSYKNKNWYLRGINASGNAQLTDLETGKNFSGTPKKDKVTFVSKAPPQTFMNLQDKAKGIVPVKEVPSKAILNQRKQKIDYTSDQIKVLNNVDNFINADKTRSPKQPMIYSGYAGTGKTTIIENIANQAFSTGHNVLILAPTNKAVRRLQEVIPIKDNVTYSTIHSLIYEGKMNEETGEFGEPRELNSSDFLIIDEASMVNQTLYDDIKKSAIDNGSKVVYFGDSFQLRPVGKDPNILINPQEQLTEVRRQSFDSDILKYATSLRMFNTLDSKNLFLPPQGETENISILPNIRQLFLDDIKKGEDTVYITATNQNRVNANIAARYFKFGKEESLKNKIFPGEKIIFISNSKSFKNSEQISIDNPQNIRDFVVSVEISKGDKQRLEVVFFEYNNRTIMLVPNWPKAGLQHSQVTNFPEEFGSKYGLDNSQVSIATYGYSITAHKAQGSEWDKAYIDYDMQGRYANDPRWMYTAVTRAKNKAIIESKANIPVKSWDEISNIIGLKEKAPDKVKVDPVIKEPVEMQAPIDIQAPPIPEEREIKTVDKIDISKPAKIIPPSLPATSIEPELELSDIVNKASKDTKEIIVATRRWDKAKTLFNKSWKRVKELYQDEYRNAISVGTRLGAEHYINAMDKALPDWARGAFIAWASIKFPMSDINKWGPRDSKYEDSFIDDSIVHQLVDRALGEINEGLEEIGKDSDFRYTSMTNSSFLRSLNITIANNEAAEWYKTALLPENDTPMKWIENTLHKYPMNIDYKDLNKNQIDELKKQYHSVRNDLPTNRDNEKDNFHNNGYIIKERGTAGTTLLLKKSKNIKTKKSNPNRVRNYVAGVDKDITWVSSEDIFERKVGVDQRFRLDTIYDPLSINDLLTFNNILLKKNQVLAFSRGDSSLAIVKIKDEDIKIAKDDKKYTKFWEDEGLNDSQMNNILEIKGLKQRAGKIAQYNAIKRYYPEFLDDSLANVLKRLKIPFTPSIVANNTRDPFIKILDSKKVAFVYPDGKMVNWMKNLQDLDPLYAGDGGTLTSNDTFKHYNQAIGININSDVSKNVMYQVDDNGSFFVKHLMYKPQGPVQIYENYGTKKERLIGEVREDGNIYAFPEPTIQTDKDIDALIDENNLSNANAATIIDAFTDEEGNGMSGLSSVASNILDDPKFEAMNLSSLNDKLEFIATKSALLKRLVKRIGNQIRANEMEFLDHIMTKDEAKIATKEYDKHFNNATTFNISGQSIGFIQDVKYKHTNVKHNDQLYNYINDPNIIEAFRNIMLPAVKQKIANTFRASRGDIQGKLYELVKMLYKNRDTSVDNTILDAYELGMGAHPSTMNWLDTILQTRGILPAVQMENQEGIAEKIQWDSKDELNIEELSVSSKNATIVYKEYAEDPNTNVTTVQQASKVKLSEINEWLESNEVWVLAYRVPTPHVNGAGMMRIKKLHDSKDVVFMHPDTIFRRFEGDSDGDTLYMHSMHPDMTSAFREFYSREDIRKKIKGINLKEFTKQDAKKYDFTKQNNTIELINSLMLGAKGISEIAKIQRIYGQLSNLNPSIEINGVEIVLRKPNEVLNTPKFKKGSKHSIEEILRIYLQAAVDNGKYMLLGKWGYSKDTLRKALWRTADGKPIDESQFLAVNVLMDIHGETSNIRSGRSSRDGAYGLSKMIREGHKYLSYLGRDSENDSIGTSFSRESYFRERLNLLPDYKRIDSKGAPLDNQDKYPLIGRVKFNPGLSIQEELIIQPALIYNNFSRTGEDKSPFKYLGSDNPSGIGPNIYKMAHIESLTKLEKLVEEGKIAKISNESSIKSNNYAGNMGRDMYKMFADLAGDIEFLGWSTNDTMIKFRDKWRDEFSKLEYKEQQAATIAFLEGVYRSTGKQKYVHQLPPISGQIDGVTLLDGEIMKVYLKAYNEVLSNEANLSSPEVRGRSKYNSILSLMIKKGCP